MTRRLPLPRNARSRLAALAALLVVIALWPDSDEQSASAADPSPTWSSAIAAAADPTPRSTPTAGTPVPSAAAAVPKPTASAKPAASPEPTHSTPPGTAVTTLATLAVKGRAPQTGYDRDLFGQAWADVDRNGCDTRNDLLRRDLAGEVIRPGTGGCLVLRGTLRDPYTGRTISFVRGSETSSAVQIDHIVPLADAWAKGAQTWSGATREAFANDPLNLQAVDGPTNLRKGDGDAATWLPPRTAVRCGYVARQIAVKHRYGLWVTAAERDAMARVLQACPRQALPTSGAVPLPFGPASSAATVPRAAAPAPSPAAESAGGTDDPRFETCRAAVDAGYGPYRQGRDAEYDWYQDRDNDGLVCER